MKKLFLFVFISINLFGAAITSNGTGGGFWDLTSTWVGGVVPGNGDSILIPTTDTITVRDTRIIGTSGVAGTAAITETSNGALVIASGGFLKVRGDMLTGASVSSPGITSLNVQAGGIWEWDGSIAAVQYVAHCTANGFYYNYAAGGSIGSHAIIRSNAGGPFGRFTNGGFNTVGGWVATYTEFTRLGDATHSAIDMNMSPGSGSDSGIKWDVQNSTFTNFGYIAQANGISTNGFFRHDNNIHINSTGGEIFHNWQNGGTVGTGTREIKGNLFDTSFSVIFFPAAFTIQNNYFSGAMTLGGTVAWVSWNNNFYVATGGDNVQVGPITNSYTVLNVDVGNPHLYLITDGVNCDTTGSIFEQMGVVSTDSGEYLIRASDTTSPQTCTFKNNLFQPEITGHSTLEVTSTIQNVNIKYVLEHNTWFGGFNHGAITNPNGAFGMVDLGEGGNGPALSITSNKSNILWNPQFTNYLSGFFNMADVSTSASPTSNYCTAAACDYNSMLGVNTTVSGTNSGSLAASAVLKGDAINTLNPEQNSKYIDPKFTFCPTTLISCYTNYRTVASYDSLGLHNVATAWNGGTTYSIGDFASVIDSTVPSGLYWGSRINFRYINTAACASANPQPVLGSNWRNCWEWATYFRIRTDVAANGSASTFIATMLAWEQAGLAPTNSATRFTYPGDTNTVTNSGAVAFNTSAIVAAGMVNNPK